MGRWLLAFLLTQLVEMPIYRRRAHTSWLEAFGASAFTHPIVWFVIPGWVYAFAERVLAGRFGLRLGSFEAWLLMAVVAETFAVLAEAAYLKLLLRPRPLSTSLIANAASVAVGLTLRSLFGLP